jgi:hypothetical protein
MKKVIHCCLAHPCWSGISGIVALVTLFTGLKLSETSRASADLTPIKPAASANTTDTPLPVQEFNLSGNWIIESDFKNSTYKAFEGLSLRYRVGIVQTDNLVTVYGEKDSEKKETSSWQLYGKAARTKFKGEGNLESLEGEKRIVLNVIEGSTSRGEITSICKLKVINQDLMEGEFSTQAANAIGRSTWRRAKTKHYVSSEP